MEEETCSTNYDYGCYTQIIVEEIALEGLDGITLDALWLRLDMCDKWKLKPVTDDVQVFIWKIIAGLDHFEWYLISKERPLPYIRPQMQPKDDQTELSVANNQNVYPYHLVNENGIRGSCAEFYTRINIDEKIRTLSLQEVKKMYGSKLVAVAKQEVRNGVLFRMDMNPDTVIGDVAYCMLERIGRGRYLGEPSYYMNVMHKDTKARFYITKNLKLINLINGQPYQVYHKDRPPVNCTLFHLPRFFKSMPLEYRDKIQLIVEYLKSIPNPVIPYSEVREKFGLKFSKMNKLASFRKYLMSKELPYKEFYPTSKPSEYLTKSKKKVRKIRIIQLKDNQKKPSKPKKKIANVGSQFMDRSLHHQCFEFIENSRLNGVSGRELETHFGISHLTCRRLVKSFEVSDLIKKVRFNHYRQKMYRYFSKRYGEMMLSKMYKEIERLNEIVDTDTVDKKIVFDNNEEQTILNECNIENEKSIQNFELSSETNLRTSVDTNESIDADDESELNDDLETTGNQLISSNGMTDDDGPPNEKKPKLSFGADSSMVLCGSFRNIERTNLILDKVYKQKVVDGYVEFAKLIRTVESSKGYGGISCVKSVKRIVNDLSKNGKVCIIEKLIQGDDNNRTKLCTFICTPDVDETNLIIQEAINRHRMNLSVTFIKHRPKNKIKTEIKSDSDYLIPDLFHNCLRKPFPIFTSKYGTHGYGPKFVKMRVLHEIVYYLVYGYDGDINLDPSDSRQFLSDQLNISLVDPKLPKLYKREISWKMFIPPIRKYQNFPEGWISLTDLILRIPLHLFLTVVNINFMIPNINEFLSDPIKRNYLLEQVPLEMRAVLTVERKFIHSIYFSLRNLSLIGLLQIGERKFLDLASSFVFINRKTNLLDTTISPRSYYQVDSNLEYERKNYEFNSSESVSNYWNDAAYICVNTKLIGHKKSSKMSKENLEKTVTPKSVNKVLEFDNGDVPGDRLGAGGFDSSLFSHIYASWFMKNKNSFEHSFGIVPTEPMTQFLCIVKYPRPGKTKEISREIKSEVANNNASKKVKKEEEKIKSCSSVSEQIVKKAIISSKFNRPVIMDEHDINAIKNMDTIRSVWSKDEDDLLLLGILAASYAKCVPVHYNYFHLLREILNNSIPKSKNKTSYAIRRRINKLLKDPMKSHGIDLCLKELQTDETIEEKYRDKLDSIRLYWDSKNQEMWKLMDSVTLELFNILSSRYPNIKKYTCSSAEYYILPDDVRTFREQYSYEYVSRFNKGNSVIRDESVSPIRDVDDIIYSVISSIIYSTLLSQRERAKRTTSDIHTLERILKQFSSDNLSKSFLRMRNLRMISIDKSSDRLKTPAFIPTYHLSVLYRLQFRVDCDLQIFHDSYLMYTNLLCTSYDSPFKIRSFSAGVLITLISYFAHSQLYFITDVSNTNPNMTMVVRDNDGKMKKISNSSEKSTTETVESVNSNSDLSDEDEAEEDNDDCDDEKLQLKISQNLKRDNEDFDARLVTLNCFLSDIHETGTIVLDDETRNKIVKKLEKTSIFKGFKFEDEIFVNGLETSLDKDRILAVLNYLKSKESMGASIADLMMKFNGDKRFLKTVTNLLLDNNGILRSGTTDTRYIHRNFTDPWLMVEVKSGFVDFYASFKSEARKILIRPWILFNGSINRYVLDSFLIRIMLAVYQKDGVYLTDLQNTFVPALFPHYTRELVEILVDLGAVKLIYVTPQPKVTCFSDVKLETKLEDATGFEEENRISCQAEPNSLMKLSAFIGDKNLRDDTLSMFAPSQSAKRKIHYFRLKDVKLKQDLNYVKNM